MTIILSRADVQRCLSMSEMIARMEIAFRAFHRGNVQMPERVRLALPNGSGYAAFMPGCVPEIEGLGIKVNTNFKKNPERFGLPSILGLIILLDMKSGVPKAIMDSTLITAFRTGAVSGLATRYLAREDVRRLGVLGSGAQSVPQIQAVAEVRGIEKVSVYSPNLASKKDTFLAQLRPVVSADVEIGASAESVVRQADVLVLCSNSSTPILQGEWVQDGTCILAIGNASPNTREVDGMTVARSRVVCDSFRACLMEAGDLLIPLREGLIAKEHFQLDLGEIIENPERQRRGERDITLFKSVGLGFQDIVAAAHVYSKALAGSAPLRDFHFFEDYGFP